MRASVRVRPLLRWWMQFVFWTAVLAVVLVAALFQFERIASFRYAGF